MQSEKWFTAHRACADGHCFCFLVDTTRWSWHIRSLILQPSWGRFPWALMRWTLFEEKLKNCEKGHYAITVLSCLWCWLALYSMSCALQVLSALAGTCDGHVMRCQVVRGFQWETVFYIRKTCSVQPLLTLPSTLLLEVFVPQWICLSLHLKTTRNLRHFSTLCVFVK